MCWRMPWDDTYVEAKTQEWIEFRTHVSTWELNQYLATY